MNANSNRWANRVRAIHRAHPSAHNTKPSRVLTSYTVVLVLVCNVLLLASKVVPVHDLMYKYQVFHYFYCTFAHLRELAHWVPYGEYGIPAYYYQLIFLTPFSYLVGFLGAIFSVSNTLILFKASMILEELVFALGLSLLVTRLFSSFLPQLMIITGGILSTSWLIQPHINFNAHYALPLVINFLVLFCRTRQLKFLWVSGITEILSLIGNVVYFAPLHLLVAVLFVLPSIVRRPRLFTHLVRPTAILGILPIILILLLAMLVYFANGSLEGTVNLSSGRDPLTYRATLDSFLQYGGVSVGTTGFGMLTGSMPHWDNTYYIGLLPLVLFAWSILIIRNPYFLGLTAAALCLTWISIGGIFAALAYEIPGFSLYRHIGLVFGIVNLLVLVASGYGVQYMHRYICGRSSRKPLRFDEWTALFVGAGVLMICDIFLSEQPNHFLVIIPTQTPWQCEVLCRLGVYGVCGVAIWLLVRGTALGMDRKHVLVGVLVALSYIVDMGIFKADVIRTAPSTDFLYSPKIFQSSQLPYIGQRSMEASEGRAKEVFKLARSFPNVRNEHYTVLYPFAHMDPCRPETRVQMLCSGVFHMIRLRGGNPQMHPNQNFLPKHDLGFLKSLGCQAPKLRLFDHVQIAADDEAAKSMFRHLPDASQMLILSGYAGAAVATDNVKPQDDTLLGKITVRSFSPNKLCAEAVVRTASPVWLFYADAWHPDWNAAVNGQTVPVAKANIGFKAIPLKPGLNSIEIYMKYGLMSILSSFFALTGLAVAAMLVGIFCWHLLRPHARCHNIRRS